MEATTTATQLLSDIEYQKLSLKVNSSTRSNDAERKQLREQTALRAQLAEQERERLHEARQRRMREVQEETPPPAQVPEQKWEVFVRNSKVVVSVKRDTAGNVVAFSCKQVGNGSKSLFESTQTGAIGNFLLCAAEVRRMLSH